MRGSVESPIGYLVVPHLVNDIIFRSRLKVSNSLVYGLELRSGQMYLPIDLRLLFSVRSGSEKEAIMDRSSCARNSRMPESGRMYSLIDDIESFVVAGRSLFE